ncbi:MAG: protein-ADP-ribose hydrolase [Ruminococcus sp.]|nr:protein-ADP-ribose hydrolase [Ruminococcus sp.]
MTQKDRREYLIKYMLDERNEQMEISDDEEKSKRLLRALFNVRMPKEASEEFLKIQDEYLKAETEKKRVYKSEWITPAAKGIYIWRGDITTLECDAIVNAANSKMLGCFYPNHRCIDNAIHTYAGVQLRLECDRIMHGCELETGKAVITSAYNLPSRYIIHTVGPIVYGELNEKHCEALSECYRSCLALAHQNNLKSIAFCCISTGEFHFPSEKAAEIALKTVIENRGDIEVIFNAFKQTDESIYTELVEKYRDSLR